MISPARAVATMEMAGRMNLLTEPVARLTWLTGLPDPCTGRPSGFTGGNKGTDGKFGTYVALAAIWETAVGDAAIVTSFSVCNCHDGGSCVTIAKSFEV